MGYNIESHKVAKLVPHLQIDHSRNTPKFCISIVFSFSWELRETENNAYAKFWGDKQRALWYVMVFSGVVNISGLQKNVKNVKNRFLTFKNQWTKLYDVSIQMKPLQQYFHMVSIYLV